MSRFEKPALKKRLPWLIILLFAWAFLRRRAVFESVVSQVALIVCFQSLILDMAGNVGTSAAGRHHPRADG